MAANPKVYAQMVGLLKPYSKFASVEEKRAVSESLKTLRVSAPEEGGE
jgi:hypothetical protein